ncbi:MAG TPA: NADPH:quinone reductase [Candidatus Dormibacteraeota bacterium]|nr:NADPH:quinone reductase [Candidatus Dormibacteraeota bacterium]
MKAAYINQTGPPEVIIYGELPKPTPGPKDCLVKVSAVDVNPIDLYIRAGMIPAKFSFPYIIGRDLAGTIVECGVRAKRLKPGTRVWASGQGVGQRQGTFSEFAVVDETWLHPTADGVRDEDVVAISLVGITAHLGLVTHANLKSGEALFINGGSGGVGSAVVQMAKILGARVATTAGTDDKVALCRKLGADLALNYKTDDVDAVLRKFAPEGLNVWWETLREPNFERTIPLLSMAGRMIVMAGRDAKPPFPVGPFYTRNCSLHGFAMFNANASEQEQAAHDLNRWLAEGKLKARIDRVLPLSQAAEAHRIQEASTINKTGELSGKIVLTVP